MWWRRLVGGTRLLSALARRTSTDTNAARTQPNAKSRATGQRGPLRQFGWR